MLKLFTPMLGLHAIAQTGETAGELKVAALRRIGEATARTRL
jgi:hypothetical protein